MVETEIKTAGLPAITPDAAKQKLSIALTKATLSIQGMQDEADALVFNEDNLTQIGELLGRIKNAEKEIEEAHKIGKEPYLAGGRAWDSAKKDMLTATGNIKNPVLVKYTALCNEIDRRNREAEQKKEAEKKILDGIEANILDFSQKIAACATRKDLNDTERLINLEKSPSRANKYGDHHQKAIDRYNEVLLPILTDQKTKIEEKEQLEKQLEKTTDPEKHDELTQKLAEKENEIVQNQVLVQEKALTTSTMEVIEPEVITTSVKAKRTDMSCEIVDMALVFKKSPELLTIELKLADAKKLGNTLKEAGAFGDKEEIIVNGIKYSIKKIW